MLQFVADGPARMHTFDRAAEDLARALFDYALARVREEVPELSGTRSAAELAFATGPTVTPDGIGGHEALRRFVEVLEPATIAQDTPRNLAFVPSAPTEAAVLFDLVVGASSIYAGSWLEGAGAVHAENEALRWLADLAGFPEDAGGVFVSGGSAGNLSALVAARHAWTLAHDGDRPARWRIATSTGAHSSVTAAARVMDAQVVLVPPDADGRLTSRVLREALAGVDGVFAVVATAGTTNAGIIDDLDGAATVCEELGLWLHVDAAYGGAAMAAPSARHRFRGIERADSFVVDPHKWLFAPFDCAALLYRRPALARAAHTQHAEYLDVLTSRPDWNPSDYAYHLTRRARGLPFWFSLATHGTDAYTDAVEATLELAQDTARFIEDHPAVELVREPGLSVVLFRRVGWTAEDHHLWSVRALEDGLTFCVPTTWEGETVLRFCFVNPRTTLDDVKVIIDSLA